MKSIYVGIIGCILLWGQPSWAVEQRGALILNKIPIYEFEDARQRSCMEFYDVKFGRNVADMREFRNYHCQGRYEMTLRGNKGRTVTLFAQFNFKGKAGFMVIRKLDDKTIWINDLEAVTPGRWVTVKAKGQYGAYEAFFKYGSGFDQNISSIKWGQWWEGETPK